jgi:hypothetical protein
VREDPYLDFLARKAVADPATGLSEVPALPDARDIAAWALRRGRAALFAGTGLGKSFMELAQAVRNLEAAGLKRDDAPLLSMAGAA